MEVSGSGESALLKMSMKKVYEHFNLSSSVRKMSRSERWSRKTQMYCTRQTNKEILSLPFCWTGQFLSRLSHQCNDVQICHEFEFFCTIYCSVGTDPSHSWIIFSPHIPEGDPSVKSFCLPSLIWSQKKRNIFSPSKEIYSTTECISEG